MRLTSFTDLGVRAALYVARADGRRCTMGEIADFYGVSHEHMRKVVHKLARLGYLRSSRGHGGGVTLGQPAAQITLGRLVAALEEDLCLVDCVGLGCILEPSCSVKGAINRAARAFIATLDEVTLAELIDEPEMGRRLRRLPIVTPAPEPAAPPRSKAGRGRAKAPRSA